MSEHFSHNVSDSFWRCYGCGIGVGDPKLEQPCPTPDGVGLMNIEHERRKQERGNAMLTFEKFSAENRARCQSPQGFNHFLSSWSTSDWFLALQGELGEAANVAKKLNRSRDGVPGNKVSDEELRAMLRKELGDVFVYLDLLAQSLGFNIADAAVEVFNAKSKEIGYPERL